MAGFFTISKRQDHWFLITPEGEPFFSIGMNHIDSAALRYHENIHIWRGKYRNDQKKWLQESVARDLRDWGFNTVGWCQETNNRTMTMHRHSRSLIFEEYQWLDMPYCHLLPFTEAHQWEVETRYPDVFSDDFAGWCDFVARDQCARMAEDPKLIGYFYCDCPSWVHPTKNPALKGPWFDPARLESEAGRRELFELTRQYYKVTHEAVRRYDPNHLIFGDRYEAKAPLPKEILEAAGPYVDVLSFQYFSDAARISAKFEEVYALTGKPILLADSCVPGRDEKATPETAIYPGMLKALRELPCCVGWHYCGAYLRNRQRQAGFRGEQEEICSPGFVEAVRRANRETAEWTKQV